MNHGAQHAHHAGWIRGLKNVASDEHSPRSRLEGAGHHFQGPTQSRCPGASGNQDRTERRLYDLTEGRRVAAVIGLEHVGAKLASDASAQGDQLRPIRIVPDTQSPRHGFDDATDSQVLAGSGDSSHFFDLTGLRLGLLIAEEHIRQHGVRSKARGIVHTGNHAPATFLAPEHVRFPPAVGPVQPQDQPGRSASGEHARIGSGNTRGNQKGVGSCLGQVLQNLPWIENSRYDTQVQAMIERYHRRPPAFRMEYAA